VKKKLIIVAAFLMPLPGCAQIGQSCDPKTMDGGFTTSSPSQAVYKCSPKGVFVIDKDATNLIASRDKHKLDIWVALQTRVLTDKEMQEALEYGELINISDGVPYFSKDKDRERLNAFETQLLIRKSAQVAKESSSNLIVTRAETRQISVDELIDLVAQVKSLKAQVDSLKDKVRELECPSTMATPRSCTISQKRRSNEKENSPLSRTTLVRSSR